MGRSWAIPFSWGDNNHLLILKDVPNALGQCGIQGVEPEIPIQRVGESFRGSFEGVGIQGDPERYGAVNGEACLEVRERPARGAFPSMQPEDVVDDLAFDMDRIGCGFDGVGGHVCFGSLCKCGFRKAERRPRSMVCRLRPRNEPLTAVSFAASPC